MQTMLGSIRAGLAGIAAVGAIGTATPAADAMTVGVGEPTLVGRVALSLPIVVSCTPFDSAFTVIGGSVLVSVQQASGREIAFGNGYRSWDRTAWASRRPRSPCDGTPQTISVAVSANTEGPPFHGGPAVINAGAYASAAQPCFPGSTGCYTNYISQTASSGAVRVRL
jgi:hypothetical protein